MFGTPVGQRGSRALAAVTSDRALPRYHRVGAAYDTASLTEAERQFTERMRDVTLIGTFTVSGRERRDADGRGARNDRYDIRSVEKVGENLWRFNAGMQCCGVKGEIPIVIPMRFVGDSPMIMMTDTEIPGVGTFTVRLFFYGDTYSGMWQQQGKVGRSHVGAEREEGSVVSGFSRTWSA